MTTFVLVHGAWHGGWCWDRVVPHLGNAGHAVVTPTLTGLAERAPGLGADIGLRTHVHDVVDTLRDGDLHDVVLVGHSYAGFVVREAADLVPERVAELVLIDAWAGRDGESMDSRAPARFREWIDSLTHEGMIGVPRATAVGVSDVGDAAWLASALTPHPRRSFAEPTRLTGAVEALECRAIVCVPGNRLPFAAWADEFGWPRTGIEAPHDAMITHPGELATLLLHRTW